MTWNNFPQLGKLWYTDFIHCTSLQFISKSTSVLPRTFFIPSVASAKVSGQTIGQSAQKLKWWGLVSRVAVEVEVVVRGSVKQEDGKELSTDMSYLSDFLFRKRKTFFFTLPSHMVSLVPHASPLSTPCPLPSSIKDRKIPGTIEGAEMKGQNMQNRTLRDSRKESIHSRKQDSEPKHRGLRCGSQHQPVT